MQNQPIVIHPNVDLDACACVAFSGVQLADVHFVPANAKERPEICPCHGKPLSPEALFLDHPLGDKGKRDPDGTVHAAACAMPEAANADPALLAEIDQQDREGNAPAQFSLGRILNAVRAQASRELGLKGDALDRHLLTVMGMILRGLNIQHEDMQRAGEIAIAMDKRGEIVQISDFRVAILPPEEVPALGFALERGHGVVCAIFTDGHNLGVTRYPGHTTPDLRALTEHLPGWFVHSAGFLAGWGTRKAPKSEPPPADTPQNAAELLALLKRVFGD